VIPIPKPIEIRMPSDIIVAARISQPAKKSNEIATAEKKMPLLTLDPNKPKLAPVGVMTRSPHKRGTTPPQSPPTPHKIELLKIRIATGNFVVQPLVTVVRHPRLQLHLKKA